MTTIHEIRYIPLRNEYYGKVSSQTAYTLLRPLHVRDPNDVTTALGEVIKHPTRDEWCWRIHEEPAYIHPEADVHAFDSIIDVFVAEGLVPPEAKTHVQNKITEKLGKFSELKDVIPSFWWDNSVSYDDLEAAGWFDDIPESGSHED